jgi:hypothetical protein
MTVGAAFKPQRCYPANGNRGWKAAPAAMSRQLSTLKSIDYSLSVFFD